MSKTCRCHVCGKPISKRKLNTPDINDIWRSYAMIDGKKTEVIHCSFDCCEKFIIARSLTDNNSIKANNPVFLARVKAKREGKNNE